MADNVAITAGTGTSIATDDVSSVHFQKVKLDLGADGASDPVIGALPTVGTVSDIETATWDNTTPDETTLSIDATGYSVVSLTIVGTGTFADGTVTCEQSQDDGATWKNALNLLTVAGATYNFSLATGTTQYAWTVGGNTHFRVRLDTVISGTGSSVVTLRAGMGDNPFVQGLVTALISGTAATTARGFVAHDATAVAAAPVLIGGYSSAAAPTSVSADTEAVRAWFLRNGAQATVLTAAGALIDGDATNGLDVDVTRVSGTVTVDGSGVTQPVSLAALPALVAGTANIGDVDVLTVPAPLSTTGSGTEATALRVTLATDSTGVVSVDDNGASLTVDAAGDVAHGTGDSGNPVKVGYKAASALTGAEANADRVNGIADLWGRQLTAHIDPAMFVSKAFNATTTQTGTDVWDPANGLRIAVTSVVIGTYGTTAGRVILWFGDNADTTYTAGTDQVLLAFSAAPSATSKPGLVFTPASPVFCTTADRELHITTDAAMSIDVTVHGYEY
jgi:hypothetical protein